MKKYKPICKLNILFAAAMLIAVTAPIGCASSSKNAMTMTTAVEGEVGLRLAGTGTAVIDWGDGGVPETVTLSAPDENGRLTNTHLYLHTFSVTTNRIITVDGQNITHLYCDDDLELTTLDVSKNTALTYLVCEDSQLTTLDVSNNTALTYLNCGENRLTNLDVTKNTALTILACWQNQLTSLDVSKNTALTVLNCDDNRLTSLDVTQNTTLTSLSYGNRSSYGSNQLANLDVTKNTALEYLDCTSNKLTAEGLNALFGMLHSNLGNKQIVTIGNPAVFDCDRSIAIKKGWTVN